MSVPPRWVPLPLVLLAACQDQGVKPVNATPSAAIQSPADGATVPAGRDVVLTGLVGDVDDDPGSLAARWTVDTTEACVGGADGDGVTTCTVQLVEGTHDITLSVTDPAGASTVAAVTVTASFGNPPTATVTSPDPATVYRTETPITLAGVVADTETPADALTVWWEDGEGARLVTATPDASGTFADPWTFSEPGTHFLSLWVEDADGLTASASVEVQVVGPGTDPTCALTAPVDGSSAPLGSPLTLVGQVGDAESAPAELVVEWSSDRDGALGASTASDTGHVELDVALSPGPHRLTLAAVDPDGRACAASVTHTVTDPPVVVITDPTAGAVANEGDPLTFTAEVGDSVDPPDTLTLEWSSSVDGVLSTAGADATGLATFTTDTLAVGDHLVTLRVTDADGEVAQATVSLTVNGWPTAPGVSLSPASPTTADDLVVTLDPAAADPDGDALTTTYAWYVDGVRSGASTSGRLPAAATARGETWRVVVTATDPWGAAASAEASATVGNSAPTLTGAVITPDPAVAGDTLACAGTGFADADGDADASTVSWTVNGAPAGTGSPLGTAVVKGDVVTCTVTPSDGITTGTPVTDTLTVGNSAPVVASATLGPDPADTDDTLTVTVSGSDPDGDALTYTYAWYVDSALVRVGGTSLDGTTSFSRGQAVQVIVVASDGTTNAMRGSNTVVIRNSAPTVASVTLTPSTPRTDDTVTAVVGASDPDGDALTHTYAWYVDGTLVGATGSSLGGSTWFDKGQTVQVVVTTSDGSDSSAPASSATLTVQNSPPTTPVVGLGPSDPMEGVDDLECTLSGTPTDADGDALAYAVTWTVDGAPHASPVDTRGLPGDTVPAAETVGGDTWTCTVTVTDSSGASAAASASVDVLGEPLDYAHVQFPCAVTATAGSTFTVYGWAYLAGVTEGSGEGGRIDAELGVGPDGSDPETDAGWTWTAATYHGDADAYYPGDRANDEYRADGVAPMVPGAYDYAYRFTTDAGVSWVYADLGGYCGFIGTTDGYQPGTAGALTVP